MQFLHSFKSDFAHSLGMQSLQSIKLSPNTCDCLWWITSLWASIDRGLPSKFVVCMPSCRKENYSWKRKSWWLEISYNNYARMDHKRICVNFWEWCQTTANIWFNLLEMIWIKSHWTMSFCLLKCIHVDKHKEQFLSMDIILERMCTTTSQEFDY